MIVRKDCYKMNPIEKLQVILKEMEGNKAQYVTKLEKDFTCNRKVSFYEMMWLILLIGANSMSEEIRRTFNNKNFSYISEAAIIKSRSKINLSTFEQLFHKFNDTLENPKSTVPIADSATISNQYGGANTMHINFAYDILNKNFLDCVIEAKNKVNERKGAIKMLSSLDGSEKILAILDRGYDGLKVFEHCNRMKLTGRIIR
ncbi:MAG: transposase [Selenomonadaceae bacterium]|nr:transposase [Selenomonadaceae bacterium]